MYKDCFKLMDINKDGTLDKNDLRGAFDNIGVLMSESELDDLMGEVGSPCTFQGMVDMFQSKMAGDGNDPDELIIQAFSAYDKDGKIDVKMFLMFLFFLFLEQRYEKLSQIPAKLKYKLQDDQKIKISVGIRLDLLHHQHHKKMYLDFDQLII